MIRDSHLGRVNLTCCDLRGTQFIHVDFVGDETCFTDSLMDSNTTFLNCSVEPLDQWITVKKDPDLVKHHLVARGANVCCQVRVSEEILGEYGTV